MIKNVVILSEFPEIDGGGVAVAIDTACLLAQHGLNVYYFSGAGNPDPRLLSSPNIKVVSTGQSHIFHDKNRLRAFVNGIYNFKAARILRELLATLDKEETVVHVHCWARLLSPSVFKAANDMGFRIFITIHDYLLSCPDWNFYDNHARQICERTPMSLKCFLCNCDKRQNYVHKVYRFFRQYVQNWIVKRINMGYIFISEFSKHQLLRRMPAPKNQFFVRNPIYYYDRFRIEAENNSIFLYIGRLDHEKGVENFCRAVHNTGVQAVMIGDGPLYDELKAQYPEITFTGWLDKAHIREWLKRARCLVFPSVWYEVSPLVPLEVNAYGLPVIASDCCAASDNAAFTYHTTDELEALIKQVSAADIRQLSLDTFKNFDESSTINYADNLLKVYSTPLL